MAASYVGRTVYRLEKNGTRTLLADRYEGKRFRGPNDVVFRKDGSLYFTDTNWRRQRPRPRSDGAAAAARHLQDQGWHS